MAKFNRMLRLRKTITGYKSIGTIFGTNDRYTIKTTPLTSAPANSILGSSANQFAIIAATTVTNTGSSVVTGDLALSPGTSVTGFPPGVVVGTQHVNDAVAAAAKVEAQEAYTNLASRTGAIDKTGVDLGGQTLVPGTYKFNTSAQLTGDLVLDAGGNPNALFIFQIGTTLTTASGATITVVNGGSTANVFFQVGSSATLGANTTFVGTLIAQTSITVVINSQVEGHLIALTGAVTLDTNTVAKTTASTLNSIEADVRNKAGQVVATVRASTLKLLIKRLKQGLFALGAKYPMVTIQAVSFPTFEQQLVSFSTVPNTGSFKLQFDSVKTAAIAFDATAATVRSLLRAIPGLEDVLVTGNYTSGFLVDFRSVPGDILMMTATDNTLVFQGVGPTPAPGSPNLGTSNTYAALAFSALTNSAGAVSVLNGDIGVGSAGVINGFPPGTFTGVQRTVGEADAALVDALAAYNDLSTRSATTIPSALDGQTLTAGVYAFASGAATLAETGDGTLTLSGSATDLFVIITASTLRTGAGGIPTMTLTGGALATNVYFAVGSSATINIGVTSAGAVFNGTILASASATMTQGGTVNGRLIAIGAAVTLSNATGFATINVPPTTPAPVPVVITITEQVQGTLDV